MMPASVSANTASLRREYQSAKIIRQRLEQSEKSLLELEAQKTADRDQENSLNASMARLQEKIEPGEQRLTNLEARYEQMQGDQTAAQQVVAVADRHFTQAQLELSRVKDSLDSLQRRIEEDFGLVAFEYRGDISGHTPLPLEGMVENLPTIVEIPPDLEENLNRQRGHLRRIGAINPEAQHEYLSVKDRFEFLTAQVGDLRKADEDLRLVIGELDELMKREFRRTFDAVAIQFKEMFTRLFGGGTAPWYWWTRKIPPRAASISRHACLAGANRPFAVIGRRTQPDGGCSIFSLLKVSPTPFCVLDEVDAALDEANVGRFCDLLKELSATTQFIVITHNRNTVQIADVVYGITMARIRPSDDFPASG
jgi:chromosome segregation protein